MQISGKAFVFGDRVDTDALAPGAYMKLSAEERARHCLEALDPNFAEAVQPGDVLAAGTGFGIGSSREQAPEALRTLGVGAVVARSFARIFYRNAVNLGLPVLHCERAMEIRAGAHVEIDVARGEVRSEGRILPCRPLPEALLHILRDGGLIPHLRKRKE